MNPIGGINYSCNDLKAPIVRNKVTAYAVGVLATLAAAGAITLFAVGGGVPVAIGLSVTAVVLLSVTGYLARQAKVSANLQNTIKPLDVVEIAKPMSVVAVAVTDSLEQQLSLHALCEVDVDFDCWFRDYLEPNESHPENAAKHLALMEEGLIVSTGTERSFYDLLLAPEGKCRGLIIRDINHRVKAYMDFLILLLRISDTHVKFKQFVENEDVNSVRLKLEVSNLPRSIKNYYTKNIDQFASIYFGKNHKCSENMSKSVDYIENERLFKKLQGYANEGKIITTIGDICDLTFLKDYHISVVDVSNISCCKDLKFDYGFGFAPRIIGTWVDISDDFRYFSYVYEPLTEDENKRFEQLLVERNSYFQDWHWLGNRPQKKLDEFLEQEQKVSTNRVSSCNTRAIIPLLEKFVETLEGNSKDKVADN